MAFVNGGAVVSCGNVAIGPTAGSMLLGSSAGGGTAQEGPVRIVANLIKPISIKSVRALTAYKVRIEFSRAVLNNSALADVANYAIKGINSGADVAILGVDVPNSTTTTTVDLITSEMTTWDFSYAATYLVSVNSSALGLGPQLVADWDMEAVGTGNWIQHFGSTMGKVAGSPSGNGTKVLEFANGVPTVAGAKQPNIMVVGAFYRISTYWRNSALVSRPMVAFSDSALPNTGLPSTFGQAFLLGTQFDTSFRFVQIDIAAQQTGIFIGRDGNGSPSSSQHDELSVRRWIGSGGGLLEITDSEGVPVVSDPYGFVGKGILPEILVAYATDKNTIVIQFTEPILDLGSARTVAAYTANLGLTISAVLAVGIDTITIKTSNQTAGQLYTLTLNGTWYDAAMNAMSTPVNTPVLGFVTPAAVPALLNLSMYNFLIKGIRDADQSDEGGRFVERFLMGPQTIWSQTIQTIFDIPKLWSASEAPDTILQYLKRIVGWTPDTDTITDALDFATLRRLIAASVRFWKTRGPESSIEDLLQLMTGARSYVNNWFQLRFILDEVLLGEEHGKGTDPWLLSTPGEGDHEEQTYNIRIVDNGSLNHQLVRDVAKLTRPSGERVLITYLGFLDRFETESDLTQWSFPNTGTGMTHSATGGRLHMITSIGGGSGEYAFASVDGNQDWSSYVVSWTFKTNLNRIEFIFYGEGDPSLNGGLVDYYYALLNTDVDPTTPNRIRIAKRVAGAATTITDVTLFPGSFERICIDTVYTLRVEVTPANVGSSANSIVVYLDGERITSFTTDTQFAQGTIGVRPIADIAGSVYFDLLEAEMFFMPCDSDYIDLGNVVNNAVISRGPELMADTGFDNPAAWGLISDAFLSVSGSKGVALPGGSNGRLIAQLGLTFLAGEIYVVKFTVSSYVAGTVLFRISSFGAPFDTNSPTVSANGDYEFTLVVARDCPAAISFAGFRYDAISQLNVDNVSLKRILGPNG